MCGRIYIPEVAAIEKEWHIGGRNPPDLFEARYNVAPQQGNPRNFIPVIREDERGQLELVSLQWWLLPSWSKEPVQKFATFNARVETVADKPTFREPFKRRRCLIPALGWYEWQELPSGNLPWLLHAPDNRILAFAGLWDRWQRDGQVIESCTIVVGPANKAFEPIHDRMPFIVPDDRQEAWLDRSLVDAGEVRELLQPNPEDSVTWHRVGLRVNNARNQGAELIEAANS